MKLLKQLIRALMNRSVSSTCIYYLVTDLFTGWRSASGTPPYFSGDRFSQLDAEPAARRVVRTYEKYLSAIGSLALYGRVAEIGPGDNFGVAVMVLGKGATEIHAIDRFRTRRDPAHQRSIYDALVSIQDVGHVFEGKINNEEAIRGLKLHCGVSAEDFFANTDLEFDGVISAAVFEHLTDPLSTLDRMVQRLRKGGCMVHRIDFRDHGMFPYHHPLTFLTIPQAIYTRMIRNTGRPNRVLYEDYRKWVERQETRHYDCKLSISSVYGIELSMPIRCFEDLNSECRQKAIAVVEGIRSRLAQPFQHHSAGSLAVMSAMLVVRKL